MTIIMEMWNWVGNNEIGSLWDGMVELDLLNAHFDNVEIIYLLRHLLSVKK